MIEPLATVTMHHPQGGELLAVWMPFPAFDGSQHCAGAEMFAPDQDEYDNRNDAIRGTVAFYKYAARLCAGCPFRVACAEYGIAHESDGMWGGLSPRARRHARQERRWMFTSADEIPTRFGTVGSQHVTESEDAA